MKFNNDQKNGDELTQDFLKQSPGVMMIRNKYNGLDKNHTSRIKAKDEIIKSLRNDTQQQVSSPLSKMLVNTSSHP